MKYPENLALEIMRRAIKDYKLLILKHKKFGKKYFYGTNDDQFRISYDELQEFFKSDYCANLCYLLGTDIKKVLRVADQQIYEKWQELEEENE